MKIDIGIHEKDRKLIAKGLAHFLADTYTLYLKTHNFHWNVTGAQFQTLHEVFMTQYTELWNAVDEVAERIRALGYPAPGSYRDFAELTKIKEAKGVPSSKEMIKQIVEGHETCVRTAREVFPIAEAGKDQASLDLLTQRIRIHEKTAWMLRSLLEK
jgi:starvation-inducible DNA-binding protein